MHETNIINVEGIDFSALIFLRLERLGQDWNVDSVFVGLC